MGGRPKKRPLPAEEASPGGAATAATKGAGAGAGAGADAPTPTSAAGTPPSTSAAVAAAAAATDAAAAATSKRQRKLADADVATADGAVMSDKIAAAGEEVEPGAAKRKKKRRRSKGGGGGGGGGGQAAATTTTTTAAAATATETDEEGDDAKRARADDGAPIGRERQAPTLAIALPGSAIDNTQSPERATALAGALARAAAIFCVDEVVVFDDSAPAAAAPMEGKEGQGDQQDEDRNSATVGAGAALLARILQFMETPQYLRRALVPMHPDLRLAGALPPLDAPHHARADEWTRWREGVVVASEVGQGGGSVVDVGLDVPAIVDLPLRAGARVTLAMGASRPDRLAPPPAAMALASAAPRGGLPATLARPGAPRDEGGLYWGYTVRLARSLAEVVSGSREPHGRVAEGGGGSRGGGAGGSGGGGAGGGGGYDLTIGTSERGVDAREAVPRALRGVGGGTKVSQPPPQQQQRRTKHLPHGPPPFQHALVVFGGPAGLEAADAGAPSMFDVWVNTCPGQGSRTIRTEEAVLVSLAALQPALTAARSVGGGFV